MSTEYEDVLTNQPVVIDNVRIGPPISPYTVHLFYAHSPLSFLFLLGLGNNQSWIRRPGSSKMFFPLIVRAARRSLFSGRVCGGGGLTLFFPIPIPM
jgi:hypothetical protein